MADICPADGKSVCMALEQYRALGTVEDFQRLVAAQNEMSKRLDDLLKAKGGDEAETYTTGYRNGHQNGQIELLQYILSADTGVREEVAEALAKEREGE